MQNNKPENLLEQGASAALATGNASAPPCQIAPEILG